MRLKGGKFLKILLACSVALCMSAGSVQAEDVLAGPNSESSSINARIAETLTEQETEEQLEPAPFQIKIKFDEEYETLTAADTEGWRQLRADGTHVWDDEKVSEYFKTLKEKYDTPIGIVNFTTHNGVTKQFKSSNCGWQMNIPISVQRFEEAVDQAKSEVDPAWNSGCIYSSKNGVGQKYVEVSIQEQKVYMFEFGEKILETDCVTGAKGLSDTTTGVYQVIYKASPSVLRGEDNYGNKYEQPVNYWICFNGTQGLHDATWRNEFGGDIYLNSGSHGCVNLPEEAAKQIYKEVYTYYPVIVY